ncbi:MAG: hypothetical protein NC934_07605 [Candidatus Omnitrophica bacterium]|nr:hypothetical protein [Candidatus Omnitrophota bacterium]
MEKKKSYFSFNILLKKDWSLIILILILFIFNYPYFNKLFIPIHDTMASFQIFYHVYSELFYNHQLPHWIPYGAYGIPSDFWQLHFLTPFSYFTMLIGLLMKIKNTLFLFKISIFFEQIIFLLGTYLLARLLFKRKSTIFIICLLAIGSTVWHIQILFNFRMYYLFPLTLFFVFAFFFKKQPKFIWLAGITKLIWLFGNPQYFICLWLFVFLVISAIFFIKDRDLKRHFFSYTFENIFYLSIFFSLLFIYIFFYKNILSFIALIERSGSYRNSLKDFLTYAGNPEFRVLLKSFIFMRPIFLPLGSGFDNTVYIGIIPIFFFVYAILTVRTISFLAFLSATGVLIWLSFGGIFSGLVYYLFPIISYYRHIGLVFGLVKILILFCAGFGLEKFWTLPLKKNLFYIFLTFIIFIFLVDLFSFRIEIYSFLIKLVNFKTMFGLYIFLVAVIFFLYKWRKSFQFIIKKLSEFIIIVFCFFNMWSFQKAVFNLSSKLPPSYTHFLDTFLVNQLKFQEQRLEYPLNERSQNALKLITMPGSLAIYSWAAFSFLQFDPCKEHFRISMLSEGVNRLLKIKYNNNTVLKRLLGCNYPKLRLVPNAVFCDSLKEAIETTQKIENIDNVVVIRINKKEKPLLSAFQTQQKDAKGEIKVIEFNSNEIVISVKVFDDPGLWLVYSDAFHPRWYVTVNGKKDKIYEAYLAFKAIYLKKGDNIVKLKFHPGFFCITTILVAIFCILLSIVIMVIINNKKSKKTK